MLRAGAAEELGEKPYRCPAADRIRSQARPPLEAQSHLRLRCGSQEPRCRPPDTPLANTRRTRYAALGVCCAYSIIYGNRALDFRALTHGAAIASNLAVAFLGSIRAAVRPRPRGCRTLFSSQDEHGGATEKPGENRRATRVGGSLGFCTYA